MEKIEKMRVSDDALDLVFRKARTYNGWLPKPVPDELLRQLYDTLKWGTHERKYQSCKVRISPFPGCKGTPSSIARAWQCKQDDGCSGHGHRRL